MKQAWTRWTMAAALAVASAAITTQGWADSTTQPSTIPPTKPVIIEHVPTGNGELGEGKVHLTETQPVSADQLKQSAFAAIRSGHFDHVADWLTQAAGMSHDATTEQMAKWTASFEDQRVRFDAERRKAYDKAVADVDLLLKHNKDVYAVELAASAYSLSDDKPGFRTLPWVDSLINRTTQLAVQSEQSQHWVTAMTIYADLSQLEPANATWKDKLKDATRSVRLLAVYTPDKLHELRQKETKDRKEVMELLRPTTQPTTEPSEADDSDAFKIDWHESLNGIRMTMLRDALDRADENYYRDVTYAKMMDGGLAALHVLTATDGLDAAFPQLADPTRKAAFVKSLDDLTKEMNTTTAENDQSVADHVLEELQTSNTETIQLPEEVLVNEFADGAFGELDPFSTMIWPYDLAEFNKITQGEFSGVGIQIQSGKDGGLEVVSPIEDSPAYKAGVKAGDVITHINGKNAKGITTNEAVKSITGPPGTTVVLTIRSLDLTVKDYTLRRETIKVASLKGFVHLPGGGWDYFIDPDQKIAYLRITNFTRTTGDELDKAADDLKAAGAKAIILDLRSNPGGLLQAATDVVDKFLHSGVIVSTRADRATPNQPTVAMARDDGNECDLPLVILVNQYSASASEIVSGALKDQHRATLVGVRTFGKGSVQMLFPLSSRDAVLKLTTSHYYLPSGRCIHREENSTEWGVDPDVTIDMTPEQMVTAIDARQKLDVLRNATDKPSATQPTDKDLIAADPQLSAGLLMLRLKLNGATL